jgi:hypothetical protein
VGSARQRERARACEKETTPTGWPHKAARGREREGKGARVGADRWDSPVGVWDLTAHPGLPLEVLLGRMMLPIVARWFVLGARETMDNFI